jgi:hypothetical protein
MWINDTWKRLSFTEKLLLGVVFMLLIMIATRWENISKDISDSFKRLFEKHSTK